MALFYKNTELIPLIMIKTSFQWVKIYLCRGGLVKLWTRDFISQMTQRIGELN